MTNTPLVIGTNVHAWNLDQSRENPRSLFSSTAVLKKSHRGGGIQIHIVPNLLRSRVVFVMHNVPHVAGCTETETHQARLDAFIDPNVPG
jgi:hypothetical protein